MDSKEIKELIAEEKKQIAFFIKIAKESGLKDAEIEKQVNFYLDKINELKKQKNK